MSAFWLGVSLFGFGGVILIGITVMGLWPALIGTKVGRILLAIGAGALAVLGVYVKGRGEGERLAAEKRERERLAAIKAKGKSDAEVDKLGDDRVYDELARWMRDRSDR